MFKPKGRLARLRLYVYMALSVSGALHAQSMVTPEDEFKQKIRVSQDIQPLGEKPFGENINLYNGGVSFTQTDVDAPGNGPPLLLTRTYTPADLPAAQYYVGIEASALTDWTLNVPRIETLSARDLTLSGQWFFLDDLQRCTHFYQAVDITVQQTPSSTPVEYEPNEWWHGYQMITPDGASQDLLKRDPQNTLSPTMGSMTFPIVTKQNWMISCLPQTANGQPGQGFLALAPDGTRYWFDWLAYKDAPAMVKGQGAALVRRRTMMLASRIEDRFGNSLTYDYDANANPVSIIASDGRKLTLAYETWTTGTAITGRRLVSATLQPASNAPRTWKYSYTVPGSTPVLNQVQLPDGSFWGFNFPTMTTYASELFDYQSGCQEILKRVGSSRDFTVRHPSGLQGIFTVTNLLRGRSYTPDTCNKANPNHWKTLIPDAYSVQAVTKEVLSGAGLASGTWTFAYSPANESAIEDCSSGCPSTVWTDVTDPESHATRHTFSNRFDASESLLLRTDYYAGAVGSAILRSELNTHASSTAGPWPSLFGDTLQRYLNDAQTEQLSPLKQLAISQDGDTYTWQAEAFDAYAHVTKTKRFSSNFSDCLPTSTQCIEEQTSYRNDTNLWVLGLPLTVTNVATGEVESSNTYNPSNDTLLTRARFGQILMNYTFNSAGQLASFTDGGSTSDGNHHTTTLGNYKRGIPQTIGYPDGTNETLAVDDFGQISTITDQAGHTTSYGYDSVGRITGISYPAGDEVAWLPKTFTYTFVSSAERGLAANHWKRTTTTGSAKAVTYFNAMLQPVLSDSIIGSAVQVSTLTTYDAKGQKVFSAYPSASALTFSLAPTVAGSTTTYDALGRATRVQQDSELGTLTSSTAYLSGARQQVTDPKGKVTTTTYQVFDSPSYDAPILVQAPAGITQTIARDVYGNPLSITQSGLYGTETNSVAKTLTYDSYHRLCRTTEPESGSTVMAYDSANHLAWSAEGLAITGTGCGQEQVATAARTTRTYDAMNRIFTILPPVGTNTQSTQYHYTPLGQPDHVVSGNTTWDGAYNYRGMLTGESLQVTGQNAWGIGYAHDAYGSLSLIHYPDGENVSYAPDALGRPTQVGSYASGIGYFPNGQVSEFTYGNGTAYVAEQNGRQLLSNFSYGTGTTAQLSEDMSYDANGNITDVTDLAGGPRTKAFSYDDLNRLSTATATGLWGSEAYTYDALNNLRSRTSSGQTATYHYDTTNKLASISNGASTVDSFLYDTRGNVTGKNAAVLMFDQKNQLSQIVGYDSYAYDAAGRRVKKTPASGGAPTYYFYSRNGQLMYELAAGSAQGTNFIYLGTKLVARDVSTQLGAPATITFDTNPNNGSFTVSWGAVVAATGYVLQESADGGAWTTVYSGSATSAALSGKGGGDYVYRAQGCIGGNCGAFTSSDTLGVRPTLPTVTVPTGTINGNYTVSWTAPSTANTYMVQERLNGGAWVTIANSAATSISRPGTTSGSYTYQVAAYNVHGTRGWATSAAVTVDTTYGVLPTQPASLAVPATSGTGSATLSWGAAALATTYTIQQSSNGGTSWSDIYNSNGTSTAVSGLVDGSYVYQVKACNTYGCSAWRAGSGTLVVGHVPAAPASITVPATSSGTVTVSWPAATYATGYTLQQRLGTGAWGTVYTGAALSKALNLTASGSYTYQVQATNSHGNSAYVVSSAVLVTIPPASAPGLTVPASSNTGSYTVSWTAVSGATSYALQEQVNGGAWTTIQATGATSKAISGKGNGSYGYRVQACNAGGCGPWSSTDSITVALLPAVPTGAVVVDYFPSDSIEGNRAQWNPVSGATRYEAIRNDTGASVYSGTATSFVIGTAKIPGLPPYYAFSVRACNAVGCSAWAVGH